MRGRELDTKPSNSFSQWPRDISGHACGASDVPSASSLLPGWGEAVSLLIPALRTSWCDSYTPPYSHGYSQAEPNIFLSDKMGLPFYADKILAFLAEGNHTAVGNRRFCRRDQVAVFP